MKRHLTLIGVSLITFLATIVLYAIISPNPVSGRIGFAVLASTVPALCAIALLRFFELSKTKVAALYLALFAVLQVVWGLLRG
jgi:hypothetical protein